MIKEQILNSIPLKKRFVKDCDLPITVFDEPYFTQRLQTLNHLFESKNKFEDFCYELDKFNNEQEYFEWYNSLKDKIINRIKKGMEDSGFNREEIKILNDNIIGKRNLYIEENDGGTFISIDMRKANLSSLYHYDSKIFDNCGSWENFVSKFTQSKHIANSKYFRQVVFGACNPNRQIKYEKYLTQLVYLHLKDNIENLNVFSVGEDEIIIRVTDKNDCYSLMHSIMDNLNKIEICGIGHLYRVELFNLKKLGNYGWEKSIIADGLCDIIYWDKSTPRFQIYKSNNVLKCVDAEIFHQVVKLRRGEKITEDDLVFYHNGQLAKYLKEIDDPWSVEKSACQNW